MSLDRRQGGFAGTLAALLVLALLLAGCGGDDGTSDGGSTGVVASGESDGGAGVEKAEEFGSEASPAEAKQPEAVLRGYFDARANGAWSKACSYLAKELRQVYEKFAENVGVDGCPGFTEKTVGRLSPGELDERAEVEVESVRIEGDSGYVIYTDGTGKQAAKPIVKEGGAWKLNSLLAQIVQQSSE